jgi:hypothetical protein
MRARPASSRLAAIVSPVLRPSAVQVSGLFDNCRLSWQSLSGSYRNQPSYSVHEASYRTRQCQARDQSPAQLPIPEPVQRSDYPDT